MNFILVVLMSSILDGSLIFLDHSNRIVESYTDSPTTHVGVIVNINGVPYVYEAVQPQVRRMKLSDYLQEVDDLNAKKGPGDKKMRVFIYQPARPFSPQDTIKMLDYLDAQIGRKYSVKSYIQGKDCDGIHCSELASKTLNKTGKYTITNPGQVSPCELLRLIKSRYYGVEIYLRE